ncbi:MAG: alpha-L-fucosidase [Holophagales bacterium]|jgi:alpha-L-fucosidase|nr:alpha-L-fucosidase [Holophagales bacterium]
MRILCTSLFTVASILGAQDYIPPKEPTVKAQLERWKDWRFGLLMHWGPYSQWGIVESWSICPEDEDWSQRTGTFNGNYFQYKTAYEALQKTFNPTKFNPTRWAEAAKDAGMRYVVFTTKHHDGFCMFDTATTDYKVTDPSCPFSQNRSANIAKNVFDTFRSKGFGIGAYFSKPDWHSENYWWPYFPPLNRRANYDLSKYTERWNAFTQYTHQQIKELVTDYGKIDILWLDGGWVRAPREDIKMPELASMARHHQPDILIVDREVHGEFENYRTPEQKVPEANPGYPWETCMTMGDSWSYVPGDNYKDTATLIHLLCKIVSRGGNFLLNIGPSPEGDFDPIAYSRLKEIGEWMKLNAQAIHGSRPVEVNTETPLYFTKGSDGSIYAILLQDKETPVLPEKISIPQNLFNKKTSAYLLGAKAQLKTYQSPDGSLSLLLPEELRNNPPCQHAWVFKLK